MKNLFLTLLSLFFLISLNAQIEITGKVIDKADQLPIPGANIVVVGTKKGTISGIDGDFKLKVDSLATIQISFIGYKDTTLNASQLIGQTIHLESEYEDDEICIVDINYTRTISIAWYSDFSRMPYGMALHYFKPYWFRQHFPLAAYLAYKTDFNENQDLYIRMNASSIIERINYAMSIGASIHFRNLDALQEQLRSDDYVLVIGNKLFHFINLDVGTIYREEHHSNSTSYWGARLGVTKYLSKTMTHLNLQSNIFKKDIEYRLSVHQGLARYNRVLNKIQVGVVYNKYNYYDEVNLKLRYFLN